MLYHALNSSLCFAIIVSTWGFSLICSFSFFLITKTKQRFSNSWQQLQTANYNIIMIFLIIHLFGWLFLLPAHLLIIIGKLHFTIKLCVGTSLSIISNPLPCFSLFFFWCMVTWHSCWQTIQGTNESICLQNTI